MVKHEDQINKMAKNGLDKWFKQNWVDIGSKRKDFRGKKAKGGLMEATQRLRRQGLGGGGFMSKRAMMYGK